MAAPTHTRYVFVKLLCGVLFALAIYVLARLLSDLADAGYIYLPPGKNRPHASASVGLFGAMTALIMPLFISVFACLGRGWFKRAFTCGMLSIGLAMASQIGNIPCNEINAPKGQRCLVSDASLDGILAARGTHFGFDKTLPEVHQGLIALLFIVAALQACGMFYQWSQARRSLAWPTVRGEVRTARVLPDIKRNSYAFYFEYSYQVNGQLHKSERAQYGGPYSQRAAEHIARLFPARSTPLVHFDPNHPGRSVLLPGLNRHFYFYTAIGPAVAGIAITIWLFA